jgi:Bacterial protein of unknown function (DUF937)
MQLLDEIRQAQGGRAIENMARSFNITPAQAEAAIAAVLPEFSRAVERNTLNRGGLADLVGALGSGRHQAALENPNLFQSTELRDDGNAILGHVLGGKDQSRALASRASLSSGLGSSVIQMMLPYIIQMLMGGLAGKAQGGLGDILSKIPGMPGSVPPAGGPGGGRQGGGMQMPRMPRQEPASVPPTSVPPTSVPPTSVPPTSVPPTSVPPNSVPPNSVPMEQSRWPTQSEPTPVPDAGGVFGGGNSLPLPGDPPRGGYGRSQAPQAPQPQTGDNPFGDLSDIIRGGKGIPGGAGGAAVGGGMLWGIIRSVLGGALGFSGKGGIMSWLFRMVFMRYGWGLIKTIFMKVLLRR